MRPKEPRLESHTRRPNHWEDMGLDELTADVEAAYAELDDDVTVNLDRETKTELAMLIAAFDAEEPAELLRRGVRLLFQTTVDSAQLDFQLRSAYDVTYDEYLSGMTYDEMTAGQIKYPQQSEDDRRYQF